MSLFINTDNPQFSGEFFDLVAGTTNYYHGAMHNISVMLFGINFRLSKFIKELEKILQGPDDDKTEKRRKRLAFLKFCNALLEVQEFFTLFCNDLNGGGSGSTKENWTMKQYTENLMIITVAGGNIIIIFAQLITDMIACRGNYELLMPTNKRLFEALQIKRSGSGDTKEMLYNKMFKYFQKLPESDKETLTDIASGPYSDCDFKLSQNIYKDLIEALDKLNSEKIKEIIEKFEELNLSIPSLMTSLIDIFEKLELEDDDVLDTYLNAMFEKLQIDSQLAQASQGDLASQEDLASRLKDEIKLTRQASTSLNDIFDKEIEKFEKLPQNTKGGTNRKKQRGGQHVLDEYTEFITRLCSKSDEPSGIELSRIKTFIDCMLNYKRLYTPTQLKQFSKNCPSTLKSLYPLYPQIINDTHFIGIDENSDCWKFLTHLKNKKTAIQQATQFAVDQSVKFHLDGYFKHIDPTGHVFALVAPATNSTEAIIAYIKNITFNINKFIELWEKRIWSDKAAPALHLGHPSLPHKLTYEYVCESFMSLTTMLENRLVTRLSADILNYFLNNPQFNTEIIADRLIVNFNDKRQAESLRRGKELKACVLPPCDIIIPPVKPEYKPSLLEAKEVLDNTRYSEFGHPDGYRITINVIEIDEKTKAGDILTLLDQVEHEQLRRILSKKRERIGGKKTTLKKKYKSRKHRF